MNYLRYPNNIFLTIGLILFCVIIYYLFINNKIIEGAQTNEEKTKALNETIIQFTQDLYDKMNYFITKKTSESEDKTTQTIKEIAELEKNIDNSNKISDEEKKEWNDLKKLLEHNKIKLTASNDLLSKPGVAIEIQNENYTDKIRGIINKYI